MKMESCVFCFFFHTGIFLALIIFRLILFILVNYFYFSWSSWLDRFRIIIFYRFPFSSFSLSKLPSFLSFFYSMLLLWLHFHFDYTLSLLFDSFFLLVIDCPILLYHYTAVKAIQQSSVYCNTDVYILLFYHSIQFFQNWCFISWFYFLFNKKE